MNATNLLKCSSAALHCGRTASIDGTHSVWFELSSFSPSSRPQLLRVSVCCRCGTQLMSQRSCFLSSTTSVSKHCSKRSTACFRLIRTVCEWDGLLGTRISMVSDGLRHRTAGDIKSSNFKSVFACLMVLLWHRLVCICVHDDARWII